MQVEQTRAHPQLEVSLVKTQSDKLLSAKFTPKLSQSQAYLNSQLQVIQNQRNNGFSTSKSKKQLHLNNQGVLYEPIFSNTLANPASSNKSPQYSSATALMQELINSAKLQQIHKNNQNEQNNNSQQKSLQKKQGISGSFVLQKEPQNSNNIGMKFLEFSSPSVISTQQINQQLKQRNKPTHRKAQSTSSSDVFASQPLFSPITLQLKDKNELKSNFPPPTSSVQGPRTQVNTGQQQQTATKQNNQLPERLQSSSTSQAIHRPKIAPSSSSRTIRVLGLLQPNSIPNPPQLRSSSSTPSNITSSMSKSTSPLSEFVTKVDKVEYPMTGAYPYLASNNTQNSSNSPQFSFAAINNKNHLNQNNQKPSLSIDSSRKNEDILFYPITAKHQQAEPKAKRGFTSSKTFSSINNRAWDRSYSSPSNQTLKDSISKCEGLLQSKLDQPDMHTLTPKPQQFNKNQEQFNKQSSPKYFSNNERTSQQQPQPFKKSNTSKLSQNLAKGLEIDIKKLDNLPSRPLTDRPFDKVNSITVPQRNQINNIIINNNYIQQQQSSSTKNNILQENNINNNNQNYQYFNKNINKNSNNNNQENDFKMAIMSNQSGRVHPESPYYMQSLNKAFKSPFPIDPDAQLFRQHFLQTCQGVMYSNLAQPANPRDLATKKVTLGPRNQKYNKTLIFDMDETLIHCNENISLPSDVIVELKFPTGKIIKAGINIRPYAREILRELSQEFEIIIFTASHATYAEEVIKQLDPLRQYVHYRFFRDQCIQSTQGVYIKDLRIFSDRLLQDIVLIDNAAYSFCFQIDNGIPILPFYDNKQDTELLHLATYLRGLNSASDVREYNRQHLKMALFNEPEGPQKVFDKIFKSDK